MEPGATRPRLSAQPGTAHDGPRRVPPRAVHQQDVPAGANERLHHQQREHRPVHAARRRRAQAGGHHRGEPGQRDPDRLADRAVPGLHQRAGRFAASGAPGAQFGRWRLDDEAVAYPTYRVITANKAQLKEHPGFFNICIHKGLSANQTQPGGANNIPQFGNPDDLVKAASDWPQLNFIIYHSCIRPSFWVLQALNDIENRPGAAMAPTTLRDSYGHTFPNIRWSTQFAQIAAGRYAAGGEPTSNSPSSPRRLRNIYAELGTTMASMIVTFPTVWAHLIGQLLHYMGDDHIVFGSDSMWYGGPGWQINALWRSQIPESVREKGGYPELTTHAKRKILGLNSARLYGLSRMTSRYQQGNLATYATAPELQPGGSVDAALQ